MFFSNPPQSRASTYCTLAQVYNLHREFAESEKKHSLQTAGVHRELRQLRAALSSAVAAMRPADEAAGAREGLQPAPARARERRGSDASDGSTEVLHAGDSVDDPS